MRQPWPRIHDTFHCPACKMTRDFIGLLGDPEGTMRCLVCGVKVVRGGQNNKPKDDMNERDW